MGMEGGGWGGWTLKQNLCWYRPCMPFCVDVTWGYAGCDYHTSGATCAKPSEVQTMIVVVCRPTCHEGFSKWMSGCCNVNCDGYV